VFYVHPTAVVAAQGGGDSGGELEKACRS